MVMGVGVSLLFLQVVYNRCIDERNRNRMDREEELVMKTAGEVPSLFLLMLFKLLEKNFPQENCSQKFSRGADINELSLI